MNAQEIIAYIANAQKKTPVKLYVREREAIDYGEAKVFGAGDKEFGTVRWSNAAAVRNLVDKTFVNLVTDSCQNGNGEECNRAA